MPEVDPTMGEPEKPPSRIEQIKYYTSLFLGALAIVCVFGFLFLVPFVLDPAISTMMHQFVTKPVHCKVFINSCFYPQNLLHVHVCLLVLLAPRLAVGAVPVDQHHQGQDEQQVGDQQGVGDVGHLLIPTITRIQN